MEISLKWINELVNIETVSLDYLIEKLTLGGFEVEEILEVEIENQNNLYLIYQQQRIVQIVYLFKVFTRNCCLTK
jgi:hypothetical protein